MSVQILLGKSDLPSWRTVSDAWRTSFAQLAENGQAVPDAVILDYGLEHPVSRDDHLLLLCYGFRETTLSLLVVRELDFGNQVQYVDDFGTNLPMNARREIAARWSAVGGHYFDVSSQAGRNELEPLLFSTLGYSLAQVTSGWVVISDNPFVELPNGIYLPSEVLAALLRSSPTIS